MKSYTTSPPTLSPPDQRKYREILAQNSAQCLYYQRWLLQGERKHRDRKRKMTKPSPVTRGTLRS